MWVRMKEQDQSHKLAKMAFGLMTTSDLYLTRMEFREFILVDLKSTMKENGVLFVMMFSQTITKQLKLLVDNSVYHGKWLLIMTQMVQMK